jgi:hypothetical protein
VKAPSKLFLASFATSIVGIACLRAADSSLDANNYDVWGIGLEVGGIILAAISTAWICLTESVPRIYSFASNVALTGVVFGIIALAYGISVHGWTMLVLGLGIFYVVSAGFICSVAAVKSARASSRRSAR